jgi:hypothetical protein
MTIQNKVGKFLLKVKSIEVRDVYVEANSVDEAIELATYDADWWKDEPAYDYWVEVTPADEIEEEG